MFDCVSGAVKSHLLRNWPGLKGEVLRFMAWMFFRSSETGAQSVIQALLEDYLEDLSGKLMTDCKAVDIEPPGRDFRLAERLWSTSVELCGEDATRPTTAAKPKTVQMA